MGGILKNSIQWGSWTRQAHPLKFDVADGVRGFFSVLEESSALKPLVCSVVASRAPPVVLNDLRIHIT